jgi:UPF0755 protein
MKRIAWGVAALAAAAGVLAFWEIGDPYRGFEGEVFYELKRGTSGGAMARELAELGVVRSRWHFLAARVLRPRTALQAGEYRFAEAASAREVLDRIARGDTFHLEVTIPEGSNLFEIAGLLERGGFTTSAEFLRAARDPSAVKGFAPEAETLEGYLFPSTYQVGRKVDAAALCRRMVGEFERVWKELGGGADVHRTVTLASLVEKETAVAGERAAVASVYANRLELGMRLDCDPTVIYAALLEGKWRGTIYRSDLDREHPYNTYRVAGLPPGPIANPGEASLKAALHPANTSYLYFVAAADGSGGHVFSESLGAHERAVGRYRQSQPKPESAARPRERKEKKPSRR